MAMEVGHITVDPGGRPCGCGNRGCLERYASASGVTLSYAEAAGETLDARNIAGRAAAGDTAAVSAFARAGDTLGMAIATLVKVLDVSRVVVGGGLSAAWGLLLPALEARLGVDLLPQARRRLRVAPSTCADQCGVVGAALLVDAAQR
jgi:glucokinase